MVVFDTERDADLGADLAVGKYVLFDCPGQVELFTNHDSLRRVFFRLQKLGYRVRFSLLCNHLSNARTLTDR